MGDKFLLKDQFYNPSKVAFLSAIIKKSYKEFDSKAFENEINAQLPDLELKARMYAIAIALKNHLPPNFREATSILLAALPEPLDETKTDNDFGDFIYAPFADFVAKNGCNSDDLFFSLTALKEITKRFSAEFAIRAFLNLFPAETLKILYEWANDKNYHVRRLCSEGTRPKLPWAERINIIPEQTLPILNLLFNDCTRYVTRSVANHLNDLSKSDPYLVLSVLKNWQESDLQDKKEFEFIKKHALRSLVKTGHTETLKILGFEPSDKLILKNLQHSKSLSIGSYLEFSFTLLSDKDINLVIDYILYFCGKNGKRGNKKVFKIKKLEIKSGKEYEISKKHPFKKDMSTRKLYPGLHELVIQINGRVFGSATFLLEQ